MVAGVEMNGRTANRGGRKGRGSPRHTFAWPSDVQSHAQSGCTGDDKLYSDKINPEKIFVKLKKHCIKGDPSFTLARKLKRT